MLSRLAARLTGQGLHSLAPRKESRPVGFDASFDHAAVVLSSFPPVTRELSARFNDENLYAFTAQRFRLHCGSCLRSASRKLLHARLLGIEAQRAATGQYRSLTFD